MKGYFKKLLSLILVIGLILGMSACSSSSTGDPYTDTSQIFSAINRVEKFNPGGMNFSQDQAKQIIELIDPVVNGAIYTTEMAEDIYKQMNSIMTKEQNDLIEETIASLGVPVEGAVPGSGAGSGQGGGMGGGGLYNGTPPTDVSIVDSSINMFLRVQQVLSDNYLN